MSFDDFIDMLSVFSEQAPRDVKLFYAFKIYGKHLIFGYRVIITELEQISTTIN